MSKLIIGYVIDDTLDNSDGVQQSTISIGEHMRMLGHDVHYIVAQTERTDLKNVHSVGNYLSYKFNGNSVRTPLPASSKKIKKLFNEVKFDLLHIQMPFSPLLASKVIKYAPSKTRKVATFHIMPYNKISEYSNKMLGLFQRKTIKKIDKFCAVSEPALNFMQSAFGVSGIVISNPVNYKFFSKFKSKPQKKSNIVYVGRFDERKGATELVDAYSNIDKVTRNKTQLIMCGKGPRLEYLIRKSETIKLDIKFTGHVTENEKAQFLADADIAVFPSIAGESFGIVLIEAMSAGAKITIGGNNPGYKSILSNWPETLFNPKDTDSFKNILVDLIINKALVNKIGKEQHKFVKQFDVDIVCSKLLKQLY